MYEQTVLVTTQHGEMPSFAVCPDGEGPYPAVILYMDARGIREELRNMARRIARAGYFCLMPDLYYRLGGLRLNLTRRDETMKTIIRAARLSLTKQLVIDDTAGMIAWLDGRDRVRPGHLATVGYCMGGPFVTWTAEAFPARIVAAASLYGVEMITDGPDSPHLSLPAIRAGLYYGFAEEDHFSPPELINDFRTALDAAGSDYELDVYKGCDHGFCFPERSVFAPEASEQHWDRLFTLWSKHFNVEA